MKKLLFFIISIAVLSGCTNNRMKITVVNDLPFDRSSETVEISVDDIMAKIPECDILEMIVTDREGKEIPSQLLYKGNKDPQSLIFQADVKASSSSVYHLVKGSPSDYEIKAYGRFVPERLDDYTWENDRIAFRIYGPALIAKDGPSNGLDIWIKRTEKLVIDRWYADYISGKSSYHNDNGEGCDCFKVGRSLGAGAMAPFVNDSLWLGINFQSWETLDNGPLRTSFRLTYPPLPVNGVMVSETRTISLDAGSQLTMITENYSGPDQKFPVAAGIVKSDEGQPLQLPASNNGIAYRLDVGENGITYIGTLFTTPATDIKEKNGHLLVITEYTPGNPLTYYTGAGWSKWGFETDGAWLDYLNEFAQKLQSPLKVTTR